MGNLCIKVFSFINQLNGTAFLTTSEYEVQLLFFTFGKCILIIKKREVFGTCMLCMQTFDNSKHIIQSAVAQMKSLQIFYLI